MFPSSNRAAAAFAAAVLLASPAVAQNAPRSAIPWLESERQQADPDAAVRPAAEPDILILTADQDAAGGDAESLIESLDDAIIGVTPLPTPVQIRGLEPAIWPDIPRSELAEAIASVQLTEIHAANRLLIEILLTPVRAEPDAMAGPRSNALLSIGAAEDALAAAITAPDPDPMVSATMVRAGLLLGKGEEACSHARGKRTAAAGKAGIFCIALAGPAERTSAVLEAAIRAGTVNDTEASLFDAVADPALAEYVPEAEEEPSDLEIGLRRHLGLSPTETNPLPANAASLWPLLDPEIPKGGRTAVIERFEALGLVPTRALELLYENPSTEDADPAAPDHRQIWKRLLEEAGRRTGTDQARIAKAGLQLGRKQGQEDSAARLLAPRMRDLFPNQETAPYARVMQRLFLLAADTDNARIWVPIEPDADEARLFAIALAELPGGWDADLAVEVADRYQASGHVRDGQLLAALAAFGRTGPPVSFAEEMPEGLAAQLDAKTGAVAAIAALNLLANRDAPPGVVQAALSTLERAGFPHRTRQIATEVVLLGL